MADNAEELSPEILAQLVEVGAWLNSTLDIEELLDFIIEAAADVLDAESASILLADEQTSELYFAASTGQEKVTLRDIPVPMDSSIAGAIFRENRPILIADVSQDPRHYNKVGKMTNRTVRNLVGVPMRVRDYQVIGVLEAVNKRQGDFTESDAEALAILGSQAAMAINNARLLEELQTSYSALGELERVKDAYLSIVADTVQPAMQALLRHAEMLRSDPASAEQRRSVLATALQLLAIRDDVAHLGQLKGEHPPERTTVDVTGLLREVEEENRLLCAAKAQQLTVTAAGDLALHSDPVRLKLALTRLLHSAIEFTPEGGKIDVSANANGDEVWIRVRDSGPGIWPGQEEALFERFYQLEPDITGKRGGMGMGFALLRELIEPLAGRVWAESPGLGRGSVLSIAIPRLTTSSTSS